jgi:hypothetical protein
LVVVLRQSALTSKYFIVVVVAVAAVAITINIQQTADN